MLVGFRISWIANAFGTLYDTVSESLENVDAFIAAILLNHASSGMDNLDNDHYNYYCGLKWPISKMTIIVVVWVPKSVSRLGVQCTFKPEGSATI